MCRPNNWRGPRFRKEKKEEVSGMEESSENQHLTEEEILSSSPFMESFGSRRNILAAMVGAMAGSAPLLLARPAMAAPNDVKGSPNVAITSYSNEDNEIFIVYSDGSISRADTGAWVSQGLAGLDNPPAGQFRKPTPVAGRPRGSSQVCIGVIQNGDGTYLLFSDGSVKVPRNANARSRGHRPLTFHTFFVPFTAPTGQRLGGLIQESAHSQYRFPKRFSSEPLVWILVVVGGPEQGGEYNSVSYTNGHPSLTVTRERFTYPGAGARGTLGFVVGEL